MVEGQPEEFVPNQDGFDDGVHCVCQKEWKGETMTECFRCEEWFHPACLGLGDLNDIELAQTEALCFDCKKTWDKDYGEILDQMPKLKAPISNFKYQLT